MSRGRILLRQFRGAVRGVAPRLRRRLSPGRWRRSEHGAAAIEFVIIFPLIMMVFLSTIEAGVYAMRKAMLKRALDLTVRGLRLGQFVDPDHEALKARICDAAGAVVPNCRGTLLLELRPLDSAAWALPDPAARCIDRRESVLPVTRLIAGAGDQMMIVRACAVTDPVFPHNALGLRMPVDGSGGYAIVATSAFVNEPR